MCVRGLCDKIIVNEDCNIHRIDPLTSEKEIQTRNAPFSEVIMFPRSSPKPLCLEAGKNKWMDCIVFIYKDNHYTVLIDR